MSVRLSDVTSSLPIKTGHIFIGMGILMAILTAALVQGTILKKTDAPVKAKVETKQIAVATSAIPAGSTLSMDDIKIVAWPVDYVPQGSIFTDTGTVVGRVVKSDLLPGEPIYKEKLAGDTSAGGLPVLIPKGMRAVSVAVTEIKGVAGFVKPGDKVDVLATFTEKDDDNQDIKITKTVLQNVMVLASAQQMVRDNVHQVEKPRGVSEEVAVAPNADPTKKGQPAPKSPQDIEKEKKEREDQRKEEEKRAKLVSSITLALAPDQAEKLSLAEEDGEIRLVLRAEGDNDVADLSGITNHELLTTGPAPAGGKWPFKFSHKEPPKAPAAPTSPPPPFMAAPVPPSNTVEFIEGTEKSNLEF